MYSVYPQALSGEKARDLTQFYANNAYKYQQKIRKPSDNRQKGYQNFDNTTIADRLNMVGWSYNSNQTGVVKPVYGYPTLSLT